MNGMGNRTVIIVIIAILVVVAVWGTQLFEKKEKVASSGMLPLTQTAMLGGIDTVKQMLEDGADVNACAPGSSWTALHAAAGEGRANIVEVLLEHGADINRQSDRGNTPLHLAALWGRNEVVKLLLASGADVTIRNDEGQTPKELAQSEETAALFAEAAEQK